MYLCYVSTCKYAGKKNFNKVNTQDIKEAQNNQEGLVEVIAYTHTFLNLRIIYELKLFIDELIHSHKSLY